MYFGSGRAVEAQATLEAVLKIQPNQQAALTLLILQGIETGDARTGDWLRRLESLAESPPGLNELRRSYQNRFGSAP